MVRPEIPLHSTSASAVSTRRALVESFGGSHPVPKVGRAGQPLVAAPGHSMQVASSSSLATSPVTCRTRWTAIRSQCRHQFCWKVTALIGPL